MSYCGGAAVVYRKWMGDRLAALGRISGSGLGGLKLGERGMSGGLSTDVWKYETVRTALEPLGISKQEWESGWRERSKLKSSLERLKTNLSLFEEWGLGEQGRKMMVLKSPNATVGLVPNLQKKMNWLVGELELGKAQAVKALEGCPSVLGYSVENNLSPFVRRLLDAGISRKQLQKIILTYPMILSKSAKFEKTLAHFKTDLGFSAAEFMRATVIIPQVLGYSMQLKVEPMIKYFVDLGISRHDACVLVKKCPKILSCSLVDNIVPTVGKFQKLGLKQASLARVITHAPELLIRDFDTTVSPKIEWLRGVLNIADKDALMILTRFPCAFKKNIGKWEAILKSLQCHGMNPNEIAELLISAPNILGQNPDRLSDRFTYARENLLKSLSEVLACPRYLSASTERTIKVRVGILRCRGLDPTQKPLSLLCASEDRFIKSSGLR